MTNHRYMKEQCVMWRKEQKPEPLCLDCSSAIGIPASMRTVLHSFVLHIGFQCNVLIEKKVLYKREKESLEITTNTYMAPGFVFG